MLCEPDELMEFSFIAGAEWADSHPKSPWISVEERLPEKVNKFLSDEVLVRYLRGGKEYTFVTHYDYEYQTWNIPNVTHWMPIPELPKKGRDEQQGSRGDLFRTHDIACYRNYSGSSIPIGSLTSKAVPI